MQLLKITTIPLEYDLNIQNAKLTAPQIEPAKLSQHTTPAAINLQTENAKVRMDSSAMRRSMGMKSIADVSKEAPVKTQETANKVTSDYVNMGNSMVKPGMTIAQFMKQKSLSNITIDTNIRIIVPSIFRRINAKPTEHIVRSRDNYLLCSPVRPNDNIIRELQIHRAFRAFHRDLILYQTGKSRYFLHRLEITIAISRLKT